jgi:hypothetical protein
LKKRKNQKKTEKNKEETVIKNKMTKTSRIRKRANRNQMRTRGRRKKMM